MNTTNVPRLNPARANPPNGPVEYPLLAEIERKFREKARQVYFDNNPHTSVIMPGIETATTLKTIDQSEARKMLGLDKW